jgi:hypothetical protein
MRNYQIMLFLVLLLSLFSCKDKKANIDGRCDDFVVSKFDPLNNISSYNAGNKTNITLDYAGAFDGGFVIPSVKQIDNGYFRMSFFIKNKKNKAQKFYYKIFYQNESYKFPEKKKNSLKENEFAAENFYGSWEDTDIWFKTTCEIPADGNFYQVDDLFRITGNPRNEERYFSGSVNDRWKRNPRVGTYSFLLVVMTEREYKKLPLFAKDISKQHCSSFVNPYYYFLYGQGSKLLNCLAVISEKSLRVVAKPDLSKGIFIPEESFYSQENKNFTGKYCGNSDVLYKNAAFKHFAHFVDPSYNVKNIPVIADIVKDNYSMSDYKTNMGKYSLQELIKIKPEVSECPCRDISYDSVGKKLIMSNPAASVKNMKKQNIGIISRHGFSYGKYTVKLKMQELLNKNDIWNGITNAIWLITATTDEWNSRRICYNQGYLANYYGGNTDKRVWKTSYSEIDFEILKSSYYCGQSKDNIDELGKPIPYDFKNGKGNITINCTNWDMANPSPSNYGVGCQDIVYNGDVFTAHRWDYWYRAITEKTSAKDDELFGKEYYYFQIEWKPTEIIWRAGPEKDLLKVVGYMNDEITSIPDNQMLLIISQEFHDTKWWPGSPYEQGFIPFPKNNLRSEILEIEIE